MAYLNKDLATRESVACPICGTPSNWVTDKHCFCMECYIEFNPKMGKCYRIDEYGRLTSIDKRKHEINKEQNDDVFVTGIEYWRTVRGYSLSKLSRISNIAVSTLSLWNNMEMQPTLKNLQKLSLVLEVSVDELLNKYPKKDLTYNKLSKKIRIKNEDIKNNIHKWRVEAGLTQMALAKKLNKSSATINFCENNPWKISTWTKEDKEQLANVLGVSIEELLIEIKKGDGEI